MKPSHLYPKNMTALKYLLWTHIPDPNAIAGKSNNMSLSLSLSGKKLGKKISSVKMLAKKVTARGEAEHKHEDESSQHVSLLPAACREKPLPPSAADGPTPTGFVAVYAGEERRRFVVPTEYLSHPLFRMLLEKAYEEFGFDQSSVLAVPCSVSAFQEIVTAVERSPPSLILETRWRRLLPSIGIES